MIAIIDYGMGNIRSLQNALDFLGCESCVTNEAETILSAEKIILPGVGTFRRAMENLQKFGLIDVLDHAVHGKHTPILGICLGMQILAGYGEEDGPTKGLNWIGGSVKRFSFGDTTLRVPHIGFNVVHFQDMKPNLFSGLKDTADFYFVHSYHMVCDNEPNVSSWTYYGEKFVSSVQKDNIFGVQFHPEKSQSNGLTVLKNFISIGRSTVQC